MKGFFLSNSAIVFCFFTLFKSTKKIYMLYTLHCIAFIHSVIISKFLNYQAASLCNQAIGGMGCWAHWDEWDLIRWFEWLPKPLTKLSWNTCHLSSVKQTSLVLFSIHWFISIFSCFTGTWQVLKSFTFVAVVKLLHVCDESREVCLQLLPQFQTQTNN